MIQAGYPPKMLQEILGHASITTTLDLYGHLYAGDMDKYADRLDAAASRTGHPQPCTGSTFRSCPHLSPTIRGPVSSVGNSRQGSFRALLQAEPIFGRYPAWNSYSMKRDFGGEAAGFYQRYRHGYPGAVIDVLAGAFRLTGQDVTVDLGCGTGQLTLPMARRVRAVVGVDVEPDMLEHAQQATRDTDVRNVTWMLGADTDIPALRGLLGDRSVGAVTIAQALHWMDHRDLFRAVVPLVRPGGGVAVVTNGTPLWLQETDWSWALRDFLEHWLGAKLTYACGTDEQSQQQYREELAAAGFEVLTTGVDYVTSLNIDQLVGGLYSAMGSRIPSSSERPGFAEQVRSALTPHDHFSEHVHVAILTGTR